MEIVFNVLMHTSKRFLCKKSVKYENDKKLNNETHKVRVTITIS